MKVEEEREGKAASSETFKTAYYALVIGNNDYRYLPRLRTAVNDAKEVKRVLTEKYGFKTKLLLNATRRDILAAIDDFRKKLSETDSFLIYYAGHSEYNKTADKGYWLPVDAGKDDSAGWIMAEEITSNIKRITAKHVLIVSDSYYSGSLNQIATTQMGTMGERADFLEQMMEHSSRTLMVSGGSEPFPDAGSKGHHSVFASAFLMALNDSGKKSFTAEELLRDRVKELVLGKSGQTPDYYNIRNSGHEGGDFVFQLAQAGGTEEDKTATDAGSYETAASAEHGEAMKSNIDDGTYTDPETGMEFVLVKGGCYQMGDTFGDGESDEKPVHEVCVGDFYIGKFAVNQGQWKIVLGYNPSAFGRCGDTCSVEEVSWFDAQEFISILNERTGRTYRLPTEAEWEYAARSGGKNEKYAGTSNDSELGDYAWYSANSGGQTHPEGQKEPNGLGIYDMTGNVWEWVQDTYSSDAYAFHSRNNPLYAGSGAFLVSRGGCWGNDPEDVRAARRYALTPGSKDNGTGFRLAITPSP